MVVCTTTASAAASAGGAADNAGGTSTSTSARGGVSKKREEEVGSRACLESFYFIMLNILRSVGGIACGRDADPLFTLVQATEMLSRSVSRLPSPFSILHLLAQPTDMGFVRLVLERISRMDIERRA